MFPFVGDSTGLEFPHAPVTTGPFFSWAAADELVSGGKSVDCNDTMVCDALC